MTLLELAQAVDILHSEIDAAAPGAPELAQLIERGSRLQSELNQIGSIQGPLIPDASQAPTFSEQTVTDLRRTLRSLISAAHSKRVAAQ